MVLTIVPTDTDDRLPCQQGEDDLWFSQTPDGVERAKALCGPCPARQACLRGALRRREPWGVWGGQLVERGVVLARKAPMGRPRKGDRRTTAA